MDALYGLLMLASTVTLMTGTVITVAGRGSPDLSLAMVVSGTYLGIAWFLHRAGGVA